MTRYVLDFDWVWDANSRSTATLLSCENRKVNFHSEYSCGTAAIRGSKELADGQHFWEIKMTSPVYGTDMVKLDFLFSLVTKNCPRSRTNVYLCLNVYLFLHRWLVSVHLMSIWTNTDIPSAACWEKMQTAGGFLTLVT